jgi:uncharacterized membrane protein
VTLIRAYFGALVAFLAIDLIWISLVAQPMYEARVGDQLRSPPLLGAAGVFYLVYVAGIVHLAVLPSLPPGRSRIAWLNGAVLGGLGYGTYAFTNLALLEGWTLDLALADVAWGIVLTAVTAVVGRFAARGLGGLRDESKA